jgi:4-diphosphocytidyl-2-C-methyl-D-erythritol kinase
VDGFTDDTLVAGALERLAEAAGVEPRWAARLWKSIPVASGLGGGSSDAATALRLANATLPAPLPADRLAEVAAAVGSDVPFFLTAGPQLGEANGTRLSPLDLPQDYWVVLLLPRGESKPSTASVYEAFDRRGGADGYEARREELLAALGGVRRPRDLAALPPNDLASSPHADRLRELGAFRADVTGAGPTVYGLFLHEAAASAARKAIRGLGRVWITVPAWYG